MEEFKKDMVDGEDKFEDFEGIIFILNLVYIYVSEYLWFFSLFVN